MSFDIDAIRARADKATPGPWEAYDANEGEPRPLWSVANFAYHNPHLSDEDAPWIAVNVEVGDKADAEFIAHAREDVPLLLAEIERLRARNAKYENAITWNTTCLGCSATLDASYAETVRAEQAEARLERAKPVLDAAQEWFAAFDYDELDENYSAEERALFAAVKANPSCQSCGSGGCAGHTKAVAE